MNVKDIRITGLPLKYFIPFTVIVLTAAYMGRLNNDFVGASAFLMVIGGIFFWLGGAIPFVNSYLGGACLFPLFGASMMVHFGLVPDYVVKNVDVLMKGGFQNLYIAAILVGSILCMNRKTLLSATARYLPSIIGSQIFAIVFLALASVLTGTSIFDGIFMVGALTMAGGSGGAITTLPAMYSGILNRDATSLAGPFLAFATISNVIAVVGGALLNKLGQAKPSLTGNGNLLIAEGNANMAEEKRPNSSLDYTKLGAGLFLSVAFMVAGNIISMVIPQIHQLAWTIILVIAVKAFGWLDDDACDSSNYWFGFMLKNLLPLLIAGIGIASMDFAVIGTYFTVTNLIIIFSGVFGATLGAMVVGRLFGLYPVETGVSVGLCCCNIGGSGDLAVLSAADRMSLLPFASISTRIGGALMLVEISFLLPFFLNK